MLNITEFRSDAILVTNVPVTSIVLPKTAYGFMIKYLDGDVVTNDNRVAGMAMEGCGTTSTTSTAGTRFLP